MTTNRQKIGNWFRNSISAKMLTVGFLILILLIPLGFVKDLIRERGFRQAEVIEEINTKWGNQVVLNGPILKIPYHIYVEEKVFDEKTKTFLTSQKPERHYAYFFPWELDIQSKVQTKPLERGIYESVVFSSENVIKGKFAKLNFAVKEIKEEDILWDKATLLYKTSNLKGIRNTVKVGLGEKEYALKPKFDNSFMNTLESGYLSDLENIQEQALSFQSNISINGSNQLQFIPIGKETMVNMKSNWHSPSFNGNFLPDTEGKKITDAGFEAKWKILETNRRFGQYFFDNLPDLSQFSFGTEFLVPIDDYQKTERTSKYGLMIIGLTLLVFLLIQISSKIPIHPFQYLMIGLALVMFYTLLISISEHQNYLVAYLISSIAVVALITTYSRSILKHPKFTLLVLGSMFSLYAFIFVIIQLEDFALLVGSIGLFIILGIIMFTSRKIDWNGMQVTE
ncbi:cell envelope integrity protein CreD [Muricauda sp. 2012CJ35-5]|uniref:Cell envelope integrity protein CreD n=1 Tax=Flagellimonas spongiicola TaxID=2942208 RepID=A0ABT0PMT3_9FLAO|nr:cell envelope integrity protein CreD [Allomuricauda spongiicola]MCL6272551.1 cell envelope integrity protein CreD [Allomuricauda spongiicola]